jgi:hypothetical protein
LEEKSPPREVPAHAHPLTACCAKITAEGKDNVFGVSLAPLVGRSGKVPLGVPPEVNHRACAAEMPRTRVSDRAVAVEKEAEVGGREEREKP